jgi:hypothetical protein
MREDEELISTARGTRAMKQCSLDTRSGGPPEPLRPSGVILFRMRCRDKPVDRE